MTTGEDAKADEFVGYRVTFEILDWRTSKVYFADEVPTASESVITIRSSMQDIFKIRNYSIDCREISLFKGCFIIDLTLKPSFQRGYHVNEFQ